MLTMFVVLPFLSYSVYKNMISYFPNAAWLEAVRSIQHKNRLTPPARTCTLILLFLAHQDARDGERECVSPRTIEELGVKVINKTSTWSCTSVHQWGIRRSLVSPSDSIHSSSSTHTHHFLTQPTLFLHTEYYYSIQYKYFYDSTWKMVNIGYTV